MKAFEQLTVTNAVKALNPEIYKHGYEKSTKAIVAIRTGAVYYRADGGDPSSAGVGIFAADGDVIELEGFNDIQFFKAIRSGSVDAVLSVDFS